MTGAILTTLPELFLTSLLFLFQLFLLEMREREQLDNKTLPFYLNCTGCLCMLKQAPNVGWISSHMTRRPGVGSPGPQGQLPCKV